MKTLIRRMLLLAVAVGGAYLLLAWLGVVPWFDLQPWAAHYRAGERAFRAQDLLRAEEEYLAAERKAGDHDGRLAKTLFALGDLYTAQAARCERTPMTAGRATRRIWHSLRPGGDSVRGAVFHVRQQVRYQRNCGRGLLTYRRALDAAARAYGRDDARYAAAVNRVGRRCYEAGLTVAAETYYREAYTIYKRTVPPEHPDLVAVFDQLDTMHKNGEDAAEALALYQDRAADCTARGAGARTRLLVLLETSERARWASQPAVMRDYAQRALDVLLTTKTPLDDALFRSFRQAIGYLTRSKDYPSALRIAQQITRMQQQACGPWAFETGKALSDEADVYLEMGQYARAERLYRRVIAIADHAWGGDTLAAYLRQPVGKPYPPGPVVIYTWETFYGYTELLEKTGRAREAGLIRQHLD